MRSGARLGLSLASLCWGCGTDGGVGERPATEEADGSEVVEDAAVEVHIDASFVTSSGESSQVSEATTSNDGQAITSAMTTPGDTETSPSSTAGESVPPSSEASATAESTEAAQPPASPCAFSQLSLSRRDIEVASVEHMCLTLENQKLDVTECSEQVTVQLVIDPANCRYQVVSKEDHIYTDPGGDRYPRGVTCLSAAETLGVETCDTALSQQRFELVGGEQLSESSLTAAVKLKMADGASCVWLEAAGASLGSCADPKADLALSLHRDPLGDATLSDVPIDVGHGNNWDTAGTELPLVQLVAAQGYRYFADEKYLEQVSADAFIELELESSVTGPFMVHTNYATPFEGATLAVSINDEALPDFEFIDSHAWRTVRAGPSFRVDLVEGERSRIRLASLNGLPHRIHRLYLTPPLPETDKLGTTTTIGAGGASIAPDAVHDIYRIGAAIEDDVWWWRAAWTHARLEYAVSVEQAGAYVLNVAYRAQASDTEARWGKRIVLDDDYDTFQTIEVEGDTEGVLSATLELSAGSHRILLEHAGHDVGEPMLGNVWTSALELVPAP